MLQYSLAFVYLKQSTSKFFKGKIIKAHIQKIMRKLRCQEYNSNHLVAFLFLRNWKILLQATFIFSEKISILHLIIVYKKTSQIPPILDASGWSILSREFFLPDKHVFHVSDFHKLVNESLIMTNCVNNRFTAKIANIYTKVHNSEKWYHIHVYRYSSNFYSTSVQNKLT